MDSLHFELHMVEDSQMTGATGRQFNELTHVPWMIQFNTADTVGVRQLDEQA